MRVSEVDNEDAQAARSVGEQLRWLLDDLIERAVGAEHAVLISRDGLLIARSGSLPEEDGEHLAAIAAALQSLARSATRQLSGGRVRHTLIEMESRHLLVTTAGNGSGLAVVLPADGDLGQVAYEVHHLVRQVGAHLSVQARAGTLPGTPDLAQPGV
jgi:predicted regulator of Ras-like GTPase activity (Roadblock/LC7/MglB family)